ncbi:GtrA family protein [Microbacterium memoriense]|uniref:GtrA family protein n=1 Tax=Microbacterium memoriense TaxID=2978350 RepID=A0ABT2PF88_9MICO|nr:GtrA family protein [Microbacterium memoriense]MCT9003297.1 GtrA family protein [Microbacterium memoriense]
MKTSPSESRRILTFATIGVINTAIDVSLYVTLSALGFGVISANFISTTSGLIVSFLLNGRYTFGDIPGSFRRRIVTFVIGNVIGLWLLQPAAIWIGSAFLDGIVREGGFLYVTAPKLFGVALALGWNYLWYRRIVFVPDEQRRSIALRSYLRSAYAPLGPYARSVAKYFSSAPVAFRFIALLLAVIAGISAVMSVVEGEWDDDHSWAIPLGVIILVALVAAPLFADAARRGGAALDRLPKAGRLLALFGGSLIALMVVWRIGFAALRYPGFDAGAIFRVSGYIADGASAMGSEEGARYFPMYPNNVPMLAFYSAIFRLTDSLHGGSEYGRLLVAMSVNAVALVIAFSFTVIAAWKIGRSRLVLLLLAPLTVFIIVSPVVSVPYSDALAAPFPVAVFAIWLMARRHRGYMALASWVLIGCVVGIGMSVKPTVGAVFAAVVVVELIIRFRRKKGKALAVAWIAASAFFLCIFYLVAVPAFSNRAVALPNSAESEAIPFSHFLAMGAQGLGSYSADDVNAMVSTPPDERLKYGIDLYISRVKDMGFDGYVRFLIQKVTWTLGDGSFFQWKEGAQMDYAFENSDDTSSLIQSYYDLYGSNRAVLAPLWQSAWLLTLACIALPLFCSRRALHTAEITASRIAILLLIVFLAFFEARSRYVYLYVPLFVLCAAQSIWVVTGRGALGARKLSLRLAERSMPAVQGE